MSESFYKANKVMIIDDDETFIIPLEIGLKKRNIKVFSFNNPEEAIEFLKNNKIDLVITDYHMEPYINGNEVIKRIREFNEDIPIYLETAYAEDLPAEEMLEKYQIQGYIDKGEGQVKNIQLILAGLKQAELIELVKKQKRELDASEYKNEFLGKFLGTLMGKIKDKSFSIGLNLQTLETFKSSLNDSEDFEKITSNIKNDLNEVNQLIDTLDINEKYLTIGKLKNSIEGLFSAICVARKTKLNINCDNENELINCDSNTIIYILTDVIEYLIKNNSNENEIFNINIEIGKEEESHVIRINNDIKSSELMNKINNLALFDNNINIINDDGLIKIFIKDNVN